HKGRLEQVEAGSYMSWGVMDKDDKGKIHVTELPVGMWTSEFTKKLESLKEEKKIANYKNHSTPKEINFIITEAKDGTDCTEKSLKLYESIKTTNMVLFNDEFTIKKFD